MNSGQSDDAASYRMMLDRLHHMETIAAIQEGMASAERGELKPAVEVLKEMRAKYGLSAKCESSY
jgi:predicted transcriptional regulator